MFLLLKSACMNYLKFLFIFTFSVIFFSCSSPSGGGGSKTSYNLTATNDDNSLLYTANSPFREFMPVTTSVQVADSRIFIDGRVISIKKLWVCNHEVTQKEFLDIMDYNPSVFKDTPDMGEVQNLRPVEAVTWNEAIVYCNKRSIKEGYTPCYSLDGNTNPDLWGEVPIENNNTANREKWLDIKCDFDANGYRLPKEVEWEYAARGGDLQQEQTLYSGCNEDELLDYAWIYDNSNNKTHQVMLKKPNALGLYDMSGNVFEWVWDNFSYDNGIKTDTPEEGPPQGEDSTNYRRRARGGAWSNGINGITAHGAVPPFNMNYCNNNSSHCTSPWMNNSGGQIAIGLRVVRTIQ